MGQPVSNSNKCPKFNQNNYWCAVIKVPLKNIIMRDPRHQQRYENCWIKLFDTDSTIPVCLYKFTDTLRYYITEGVHRCNVAYDAGYDYIPAFVDYRKEEPLKYKNRRTFHSQPRNLFDRMILPANVIPEKCQHRPKWKFRCFPYGPPVCGWCEFRNKCSKDLFDYDGQNFEFLPE